MLGVGRHVSKVPEGDIVFLDQPIESGAIVMLRRFARRLPACEKAIMVRTKPFKWLIALSVAAGLLTAPLSVPAMAAPQAAAVADEMAAMAADMPCCPDQQDQTKDCRSCPFVALCTLTIILLSPNANGALIDRMVSRDAFALPDDLLIDGLGDHPPDHPPRTIV